ncbi:MAG: Holliday junction resolvase RuvX [Candidatus Dadabacteria bacterium]|nr:MAG: Holliday junction resolvase RuvX [Candidatus Dadabacteria bacterium]
MLSIMARIMAIDVGDVRVGVAISDELGISANPLCALERKNNLAQSEIIRLIKEHAVTTIVAGLPLSTAGDETEQSEKAQRFCRRIARRSGVEVVFVDEFLTTEEAKQRLNLGSSPPQKLRKSGDIDAVSASIILERYLSSRKSHV